MNEAILLAKNDWEKVALEAENSAWCR